MRIKDWLKNELKKCNELDDKLSNMKEKEVTPPLSCPADQPNTACSLVEQLREKQKELKEFQDSGEQIFRFIYSIDNNFNYGISLNLDEYENYSDDIEYLKEKCIKAINARKKRDLLRTEIAELKQQLGIE